MSRFITIEGPDGAGKTTLINHLASFIRTSFGTETIVTREPGGTHFGKTVRDLVLDTSEEISGVTEALLFAADRRHHVETLIRPTLDAGTWVICDRFIDSTYAYQRAQIQMDRSGARPTEDDQRIINDLISIGSAGLRPDLTLLLDVPTDIAEARLSLRSGGHNRMEAKDRAFHQYIRANFKDLSTFPRVKTIDAAGDEIAVFTQARQIISDHLDA